MAERVIIRPTKFEALIDRLTEDGPFETKQAAMTFAAAVGWHFVRRREPRDSHGKEIRWSVFEGSNDDVFIHVLALAETGSIEILGRDRKDSEEDPITIFEEYATAGFQYIQDKCINAPGEILDNLLSLIAEVNTSLAEPPPWLRGTDTRSI